MTNSDTDTLTPAQRLDAANPRIVDASIATITNMKTLRACIAYENSHQNRLPVLRQLKQRAAEI